MSIPKLELRQTVNAERSYAVYGVAYSPDGHLLIAGGGDGKIVCGTLGNSADLLVC